MRSATVTGTIPASGRPRWGGRPGAEPGAERASGAALIRYTAGFGNAINPATSRHIGGKTALPFAGDGYTDRSPLHSWR